MRRPLLLSILLGDLIMIAVAVALGFELWLVAVVAVLALSPTLMLGYLRSHTGSPDDPSNEAARLGHHDLS